MADSLLLIEDEALFGAELARHFRREGWDVELCTDLAQARRLLIDKDMAPLVVLADMQLPDGNALDLLGEVRERALAGEWIFLTGFGSVTDSVRALRLGAFDFLEKPCDEKRLDLVVAGAARSARAQRRLEDQAAQNHNAYPVDAFIGTSAQAESVRTFLRKLAQVPFSALIVGGETGTGKGLVTRILHYRGKRAAGPLVEVNCAALPRELLESELFGHEAGAFTGAQRRRRGLVEQASGGTLFLDEIGELDIELQAKLLKVIEDQRLRPLGAEREVTVDVQIVAASNRDLGDGVRNNTFRADLYHRLSVFAVTLPALRVRLQDLDELVPAVVAEYNTRSGKAVRDIPETVWAALRNYDWPGNVRELRNVIERCVLLADGSVFPQQWLQLPGTRQPSASAPTPSPAPDHLTIPLDGTMSLDDMDRYIVKSALERSGYNTSAAARALGTTRQTLRYRARKYGLSAEE